MAAQELPLSGVRVIEMTHMVMGPTCGMILASRAAGRTKYRGGSKACPRPRICGVW